MRSGARGQFQGQSGRRHPLGCCTVLWTLLSALSSAPAACPTSRSQALYPGGQAASAGTGGPSRPNGLRRCPSPISRTRPCRRSDLSRTIYLGVPRMHPLADLKSVPLTALEGMRLLTLGRGTGCWTMSESSRRCPVLSSLRTMKGRAWMRSGRWCRSRWACRCFRSFMCVGVRQGREYPSAHDLGLGGHARYRLLLASGECERSHFSALAALAREVAAGLFTANVIAPQRSPGQAGDR